MNTRYCYMIFVLCIITTSYTQKLYIAPHEAKTIGLKIWQNECAGSLSGLTSWNNGEDFASLGIGHFIWYPAGKQGVFKETFPALLSFLEKHGKKIPAGILKKGSKACPWNNREEFLKNSSSKPMQDLRAFLAETVDLQTTFIVQRLQRALPTMLKNCPLAKHEHIKKQFYRVARTPGGLYALIDYINFKGEGFLAHEQYQGHRWGLLQVLEGMKGSAANKTALQEFAQSAQAVLQARIAHAPTHRNEARWMPGWKKRVETYIQ